MDEATQNSQQSINQPAEKVHGNGSVAHQIIGGFLTELAKQEGCADVARRLEAAIFDSKPTEASLQLAIFGEDSL